MKEPTEVLIENFKIVRSGSGWVITQINPNIQHSRVFMTLAEAKHFVHIMINIEAYLAGKDSL